MMLPFEKRRERKDRLLKLAERERATARRLFDYEPTWPEARRRLVAGYRFELAAWQAFGAPL